MLSVKEIREIVACIEYRDWEFEVIAEFNENVPCQDVFLKLRFIAQDMETGQESSWSGRKWVISQHSTRSEIVQTCLKAVLTAEEHEAREQFKYKGKAIFGPHLDVEWMHEHGGALDARNLF